MVEPGGEKIGFRYCPIYQIRINVIEIELSSTQLLPIIDVVTIQFALEIFISILGGGFRYFSKWSQWHDNLK